MKTLTTTLMALALLWPLVVEAQQPRIGPSYDCGMPAVRQQPLAQVICSDDKLRRLDLMYVNVYAALLEQLGGSEKQKLREEANAFVAGVRVACRIPSSGWLEGKASQILLDCVAGRYVDQRAALRRRLANEALQESFLDPEEIIGIQLKLKDLGFLPDDAVADGLVGPITRQAISRWQASQNAKVTGYASQDMHVSLGRPGVAPQLQALPSAPSAARLTAIEEAFATCVDSEAKNGSYSSRDGGKSALRLMGQCRPQWKAWVERCIADGGEDGTCTAMSAALIQGLLQRAEMEREGGGETSVGRSQRAAPEASTGDRYAAGQARVERQAYQQSREGYLEFVGRLYFALQCKVFQQEMDFIRLMHQFEIGLNEEAMRFRYRDSQLEDDIRTAGRAGLARGKKPGECDYWLNNPEQVFRLRRLAASAQ